MTDILHHASTNPRKTIQINLQLEALRTCEVMFAAERNKLKKEIEVLDQQIKEKDKQIKEKDKLLKEKNKQIEDLKNQLADLQRSLGGVI
jgi:chromosome segregation ATPase